MVVFVLLNLKTESHEKLQMRGGERKVICLSQLRWDEIITLPLWRSSEPKKKKKIVKFCHMVSNYVQK